jgi:hypothetical protein
MTLLFRNNSLTAFKRVNGYSVTAPVTLTSNLSTLLQSLLAWIGTQLQAGEVVGDVVLEQGQQVVASTTSQTETVTNPDGTTSTVTVQIPTAWRATVNAVVTVSSPSGSRTFVVNSEQLPATAPNDLRDSLIGAWATLAA